MREVSLETFPNINVVNPSHDKIVGYKKYFATMFLPQVFFPCIAFYIFTHIDTFYVPYKIYTLLLHFFGRSGLYMLSQNFQIKSVNTYHYAYLFVRFQSFYLYSKTIINLELTICLSYSYFF